MKNKMRNLFCKRPKSALILIALFFFSGEVSRPQEFVQEFPLGLVFDGPDPDSAYTSYEEILPGQVDSWGSGCTTGPYSGLRGKPVGAIFFTDNACRGSRYEFGEPTGGNTEWDHPNAPLSLKISTPRGCQVSASAQVNGDPCVTVDQLLFKMDEESKYRPFSVNPQIISRVDRPGIYLHYIDLALTIDADDKPGRYSWRLTFTINTF